MSSRGRERPCNGCGEMRVCGFMCDCGAYYHTAEELRIHSRVCEKDPYQQVKVPSNVADN